MCYFIVQSTVVLFFEEIVFMDHFIILAVFNNDEQDLFGVMI